MKKGFISIISLFLLLVLSLSTGFIHKQNLNTSEYTKDLYNKKQAQYLAESIMNKYLSENYENLEEIIIKDWEEINKTDSESKLESYLKTSQYVLLDGKKHRIKISRIYRKEEDKLKYVYKVSLSDINFRVGNSKSRSDVYFRVIDDKESENLKNNGKKLKMIIKHTY